MLSIPNNVLLNYPQNMLVVVIHMCNTFACMAFRVCMSVFAPNTSHHP